MMRAQVTCQLTPLALLEMFTQHQLGIPTQSLNMPRRLPKTQQQLTVLLLTLKGSALVAEATILQLAKATEQHEYSVLWMAALNPP